MGMNKQSRLPKDMKVDAQMLVRFAELRESEVDSFRNEVARGFVPDGVWDAQGMNGGPRYWRVVQEHLRAAWRSHFTAQDCILLISDIARFSRLEQLLERAVHLADKERAEVAIPSPEAFPFQKVIMMLYLEPWRARICEMCGRHFIKELQRDRLCGDRKCDQEARRRRNQRYYSKRKGFAR